MTAGALRLALVAACPFPSPQGSQVFLGQMAERLAAVGHEVHLLTYGQGSEQTGRGYRHHRVARVPGDDSRRSGPNLAKPVLDAMLSARLTALTREHGIAIVHAHNYEGLAAALLARWRTGVPVVYHSHNLMGDELATYFDSAPVRALAGQAGLALDRALPRRADRAIALCEWSAAALRRAGCRESTLAVIPPAVDDEGPLAGSDADRRALGLDPADFVVGYVGNLDGYQNLPLLLEAFARLVARCARDGAAAGRPRLLVATHAALADAWALLGGVRASQDVHVVEVAGHAEARRALAVSDVVGLPRRLGSGYPVKLLNAMSAAKAVVTAGCGSKVLRDGVDGLVVADGDAGAMAAALERCRRDVALRRALGRQARQRFLDQMTWDRVLPQIEGVYSGLRESRSAPGSRVP